MGSGTELLNLRLSGIVDRPPGLAFPPLEENPLAIRVDCYYSYHMVKKLKVARIGNSRGVRLPASSLLRYRIGEVVLMEERSDGILLRPVSTEEPKLTWEDTAREMAAAPEDWSAWDVTASDGLGDQPWVDLTERVQEKPATYPAKPRARRKR